MRKTKVILIFIPVFLSAAILAHAATVKKIRVPRGTIITLKLPVDASSITNINVPLSLVVDNDVIVDGEVVIKSGMLASARAHPADNPAQINVSSVEAVDGQYLELSGRSEDAGSRINAYTIRDSKVSVAATSKEVRLPRGSAVTFRLPSDPNFITNVNAPLSLVVDSDVAINGEVLIKSGTLAFGTARIEQGLSTSGKRGKVRIIIRSTQTVVRKSVELGNSNDPMGTRVTAYTAREVSVSVSAASKEVRLARGSAVTVILQGDPRLINDGNAPLALVADSDVIVSGEVVIRRGAPANGRATLAENPVEITVSSVDAVDGQALELIGSSEPAGSKISVYTDKEAIITVK